jgi:hypothetical protein
MHTAVLLKALKSFTSIRYQEDKSFFRNGVLPASASIDAHSLFITTRVIRLNKARS